MRKHRDIKQRTMNRYTVLDEDVGSKYDFDDDDVDFFFDIKFFLAYCFT